MGDVKEAVKGRGSSSKSATPTREDARNLIERLDAMLDEVSGHIAHKDDDVLKEGDAAKAENLRKVGVLRAAFSSLRSGKRILEEY